MLRAYFAADVHGSELCFRKFLRAPNHYGVHVGILGGDLSGKSIVTIKQVEEDVYAVGAPPNVVTLRGIADLQEFSARNERDGRYCILLRAGQPETIEQSFREAAIARLEQWSKWSREEADRLGVAYYWLPGNDDPFFIDDVLSRSVGISNIDGQRIKLGDGIELVGLGGSNPTPWRTPREYPEEEIGRRLCALFESVEDPRRTVLVSHAPPFGSGLDMAPALDEELRVRYGPGQVLKEPVGSVAVREAIREYQPLLALCGHVHESPGYTKIGKTLCVNPGSDYRYGVLRGVCVALKPGRVVDYHLVEG